ncbi:MAG TPA: ComF family protein [Steroidobacteraceae bacterium]|nr:ComF family protein [Steroidobacteraceae bacterium]
MQPDRHTTQPRHIVRGLARNLARNLAHLIAPPVCILCGGPGQSLDEPWGLDLCIHCEAACPRAPPEPPPWQHAFCLFRYEDPVDLMIQRLKFQRDIAQARVLGTLFARAWRAAGRDRPECIVPMPLHRSRHVERGFCQTTLLARHIARRLGHQGRPLPVHNNLLLRVRATRAQSGLDAAERARNLKGAFASPTGKRLPRHVALLDDVLTTGHTATAAIAALHEAGVRRVDLWCCARALRLDGLDTAPAIN